LEEQRQFAPHITLALQGIHPQMMRLHQVSSQSTEVSLFILPFVSCFHLWLIFSEEQPVPQELEAIPILAYCNSKFWSNESLLLMRKSITEIFHVHPTRAGLGCAVSQPTMVRLLLLMCFIVTLTLILSLAQPFSFPHQSTSESREGSDPHPGEPGGPEFRLSHSMCSSQART